MVEYKKSDIRHIPLLAAQIWYQADEFELPKQTKNLAGYNPLFIYTKNKGTTIYYQPADWEIEGNILVPHFRNKKVLDKALKEYLGDAEEISRLVKKASPEDFGKIFRLVVKTWAKLSFIIPLGEFVDKGDKSVVVKRAYNARKKTANTLYGAISKLVDLAKIIRPPFKDLAEFMLFEEIESTKNVSLGEIKKRKQSYIYFNGKVNLNISVKDFEKKNKIKILKEKNEKAEKDFKTAQKIKGSIAMKGIARGKVKIVLNQKDLAKIGKGDIMVVPMTTTTPDCLVALKKASAFVTDEGGITCHAAIVAREMKKPCLIGTKIATKILKDGDLIEVNADSGEISFLA